jgi:hypothetical protein
MEGIAVVAWLAFTSSFGSADVARQAFFFTSLMLEKTMPSARSRV